MKKGWKIFGGVFVGVAAVATAPFTGGGSIVAGAAALGLGTAAAVGSAVAAGTAGGYLATVLFKDKIKIEKGLAILGMQGAGKTTIYDFLQGKKKAGAITTVDDYDEFEFDIDKKNTIVFRKGKDIGGGSEFIKKYYQQMIADKNIDYCFFVFNSYDYVNDKDYRGQVNARLDHIYNKKILVKKACIIGSFLDKFCETDKSEIKSKIQQFVKDKPYEILLSGHYFHLVDLINESQLKKLLTTTLNK